MPAVVRWILAALALAILADCAPAAAPPPAAPASEIEIVSPPLQGFYGKRLREGKIPILAHASVSDEALFAARDRLRLILERAPKIRRNLEARGHELHIVGLRQFTSDLPEHRDQRGQRLETEELFDWHMIGGHIVGNLSSCTEATLLPIVGHKLFGSEPCLHELGHAVELLALDNASRGRINAAYRRSMERGRWKNQYAAKNEREWFAELTRYYFHPEGDALAFYDYEGRRDPRLPFERMPSALPGGTITESSWAGHTFVVTDGAGRGLCTLTAADEDGTADVKGPCP